MIVIVHGPPAAGKTTLARALGEVLALPRVSTDALAAEMFAAAGSESESDRAAVRSAAYEQTFSRVAELSQGPAGFIVEGCFNPDGAPDRMRAAVGSRHRTVDIFLFARPSLLVERYRARSRSGDPLHPDEPARAAALPKHLRECGYRPMGWGAFVTIDTEAAPEAVLSQALVVIRATGPH